MAGGAQVRVLVGGSGSSQIVKPIGSASAAICKSLKDHTAQLRTPDVTDLYFDLSDTSYVDSTFLGLLLSMVGSQYEPSSPAIHLLRPAKAIREQLAQMHLIRVFDFCDSFGDEPVRWRDLVLEAADPALVADIVVQAHRQLADTDSEHADEYNHVADGFTKNTSS